MSRRVSLPGADELFRVTGPGDAPHAPAADAVPAAQTSELAPAADADPVGATTATAVAERPRVLVGRRGGRAGGQTRSTGRERHEEKITVYVSSEELFDLEHARLLLRGEHGLAVDRGRIVREALAVVLADLEAKGSASILVRRLQEG
jgi:hypothetical protein